MSEPLDDLLVEALQAAGVIMLALVAGLLVSASRARAADGRGLLQPSTERAGTDSVRAQPTAKQFAPPNQPDVNPNDARAVDELYRLLMGPQPADSLDPRSSTRPSGSVER